MWYKTAKKVTVLDNVEEFANGSHSLIGPKGEKLVTDGDDRSSFSFDIAANESYGNAYQTDVMINRTNTDAEVIIVSMIIQHKQLGGLVYQNYWYFNDEELAYEVYFEIITRSIRIRNIIENNKLNTAMTKPMMWHALHDIKGQLNKPRPYTINYLRQDQNIDDNRGVLMNNMVFLRPNKKIKMDDNPIRTKNEIIKDFVTNGKKREDLFGEDEL